MSDVDALQECLAAEHAALYGYGVLGGRLTEVAAGSSWQVLADAAYVEHRSRRDTLDAELTALDTEPVAAAAAYAIPFRPETLADCKKLARLLEFRCAAVYASAVTEAVDDVRELSAKGLAAAALREVQWGAPVSAFPGLDEL